MTLAFSSCESTVQSTETSETPGQVFYPSCEGRRESGPARDSPGGERHLHGDGAVRGHGDPLDHPELDDVGTQLWVPERLAGRW